MVLIKAVENWTPSLCAAYGRDHFTMIQIEMPLWLEVDEMSALTNHRYSYRDFAANLFLLQELRIKNWINKIFEAECYN